MVVRGRLAQVCQLAFYFAKVMGKKVEPTPHILHFVFHQGDSVANSPLKISNSPLKRFQVSRRLLCVGQMNQRTDSHFDQIYNVCACLKRS